MNTSIDTTANINDNTTAKTTFISKGHRVDAAAEQQAAPARRRMKRRMAVLFASIAGAIASIGLFSSPASAAANQWVYYDLVANNGVYEMVVWFDGYGRPTQVYADLNHNRTWDAYSHIRNGYPVGWLLNTVTEFDGTWDALVTSTGDRWSNAAGCSRGATSSLIGGGHHSSGTQVYYYDNVYGLAWCYQSSRFSGVITAPIFDSMLITLARLGGVAPSQYCYSYPTAVGCYGRNW